MFWEEELKDKRDNNLFMVTPEWVKVAFCRKDTRKCLRCGHTLYHEERKVAEVRNVLRE